MARRHAPHAALVSLCRLGAPACGGSGAAYAAAPPGVPSVCPLMRSA
ncbi:MAG: hypothetical protein IT373_34620 [Polyangiaceae bacterium]|nr:hypothetical protein [Polyangiaceae bacterium]